MKSYTATIAAAALLLSSSSLASPQSDRAGAVAQEPATIQAEAAKKTHFLTVEALEGSDCHLRPTAEEPDESPTAEIKDALIDSRTGKLRFAVLSCDGRQVLVPFTELKWDEVHECFATERSEVELGLLPEFDLDAAQDLEHVDAHVQTAERGWREVRGGVDAVLEDKAQVKEAAAPREQIDGTTFVTIPASYFCISQLDELELYGGKDEFGGVGKSIINCEEQKVEFFVVYRGGVLGVGSDRYLVPFETGRICLDSADEDAQPRLASTMTEDQLDSMVRYEEPENGILDPMLAERARKTHPSQIRNN